MFNYRITKYNPANRNDLGYYIVNEWTAISDIGRIYNGIRVAKKEYFAIEHAYIRAIIMFMDFLKLKGLTISYLEKYFKRPHSKRYCSRSMQELYKHASCGQQLNKQQVADIACLVLRELLWCKLENNNNMFVHFGYDYYMFIGSSKELPQDLKDKIENMGLFVEDFESPYLDKFDGE